MKELQDKIERAYDLFETSFIYKEKEFILHKKWNIYFRLDTAAYEKEPRDITPEEFDYKILSYLSYYCASHHCDVKSKECKWAWSRLNRWFRKEFNYDDLQIIYQKLGNGANRKLGLEFIKSNFNMELLK